MLTTWGLAYSLGGTLPSYLRVLLPWRAQVLCGAPTAVAMLFLLGASSIPEPSVAALTPHTPSLAADAAVTGVATKSRFFGLLNGQLVLGFAAAVPVACVASLPGSVPFGSDLGLTLAALGFGSGGGAAYLGSAAALGIAGNTAALLSIGLVDRAGRLLLLRAGGAAAIVLSLGFAMVVHLGNPAAGGAFSASGAAGAAASPQWAAVWLLCVWLFLLKVGPTAMFLVIVPELFPTAIRGAGVGACVMMQHMLQILISYAYPILLGTWGLAPISAGCGVALLLPWLLCVLFVNEHRFPRLRPGSSIE